MKQYCFRIKEVWFLCKCCIDYKILQILYLKKFVQKHCTLTYISDNQLKYYIIYFSFVRLYIIGINYHVICNIRYIRIQVNCMVIIIVLLKLLFITSIKDHVYKLYILMLMSHEIQYIFVSHRTVYSLILLIVHTQLKLKEE